VPKVCLKNKNKNKEKILISFRFFGGQGNLTSLRSLRGTPPQRFAAPPEQKLPFFLPPSFSRSLPSPLEILNFGFGICLGFGILKFGFASPAVSGTSWPSWTTLEPSFSSLLSIFIYQKWV